MVTEAVLTSVREMEIPFAREAALAQQNSH
jgi:hypothetical protein